jgi:hypothetical protein
MNAQVITLAAPLPVNPPQALPFPLEIWDEICLYLSDSLSSLASLALAHTKLHVTACHALYQHGRCTSASKARCFLSTISSHAGYASRVRSLEIYIPTFPDTQDNSEFRDLFVDNFMQMTDLKDLQVTGPRHGVLAFLSETFPFALRSLVIEFSIDGELGAFLETQPSLEAISISHVPPPRGSRQLTALAPGALPNLRSLTFEGSPATGENARLLPPIMAGRPVRELCLDGPYVRMDDMLALLPLPSVPLARLRLRLSSRQRAQSIGLVRTLGRRLPDLEDLELHMQVDAKAEHGVRQRDHADAARRVGAILRTGMFRKLARLALLVFCNPPASCDLPEAERLVRMLHQGCPTLRAIEFSETEMWQREEGCSEWQRCASGAPAS